MVSESNVVLTACLNLPITKAGYFIGFLFKVKSLIYCFCVRFRNYLKALIFCGKFTGYGIIGIYLEILVY